MPQSENTSEVNIIQGLQEDGFNVTIDRIRDDMIYDEFTEIREESLYRRSFHDDGETRLIDYAVATGRVNTRRRVGERCSFCLCRGHNISFCNVAEKTRVQDNVRRFTNILYGDYMHETPAQLKVILKHFLRGVTLDPTNVPVLMLYFVVLDIKSPSSADKNTNYSIHKIIQEILRVRSQVIHRWGTDDQRRLLEEDRMEQEGNERTIRLNKISALYHQYNGKMYTYFSYKLNITYYERISNIPIVNSRLFTLRNEILRDYEVYKNEIELFQRDYSDGLHPEILLFDEMLNEDVEALLIPYPSLHIPTVEASFFLKINKKILLPDECEKWTDIECPICYENVEKDKVYMTNCSHKFCYDCISKSLETETNKEQSCPCCRQKIEDLITFSTF